MAFGDIPDNRYSLRFYETGAATALFANNQFEFEHPDPSKTFTVWCKSIRIEASGGDIDFSFDGTTVHGTVADGTSKVYWDRTEAGVAVKGAGTFYIEAW